MAQIPSDKAPELSGDPHTELAALLARSIKLQEEALEISKRVAELNEQVAQRGRGARARS